MKLACGTCPWYAPGNFDGACRNAANGMNADPEFSPNADWWCSLHPAAPKPIYEMVTLHPSSKPVQLPGGFEPVSIAGTNEDWGIVCRRIIGYTKGGDR